MSQITSNQVQHIARLAKLRFTPEELEDFTAQFNQIVAYVEQLEQADTEGVTPMTSSLEELNIMRDDVPGPMLPAPEALRNAPKKTEGFFTVPKVIGEVEE
ncbi:MAG: Asp-tRNA(Asn)/Glu-tRNA(Gln) amidotransferase subunit GatC [Chlorobi bacterium]|nr:Asp-tRNA(Asn)/Glu-tRNA(Gln) amidotransferase subunit GatC [Chlorobiota bacterium]